MHRIAFYSLQNAKFMFAGNGYLQVVGVDFGERSCPPAGGHGIAKRPRALGGSWRTTKPRPAICTVLTTVIFYLLVCLPLFPDFHSHLPDMQLFHCYQLRH